MVRHTASALTANNKMTALGGQILLVPVYFLAFFVALLRLDRQCGDRASFQSF